MKYDNSITVEEFLAENIEMKLRWLARRLRKLGEPEEIQKWAKSVSFTDLLQKITATRVTYSRQSPGKQQRSPRNKIYTISDAHMVSSCGSQRESEQKDTRTEVVALDPLRVAGRKRKMGWSSRENLRNCVKSRTEEDARCLSSELEVGEKTVGQSNDIDRTTPKEAMRNEEELTEITECWETEMVSDEKNRLAPLQFSGEEIIVLLANREPVINAKVSVYITGRNGWTPYKKGITDHRGYFNYRNEENGQDLETAIEEDDILYVRVKTESYGKSDIRFSSRGGIITVVDKEKVRTRFSILKRITDE